jgi:hypothetical protein
MPDRAGAGGHEKGARRPAAQPATRAFTPRGSSGSGPHRSGAIRAAMGGASWAKVPRQRTFARCASSQTTDGGPRSPRPLRQPNTHNSSRASASGSSPGGLPRRTAQEPTGYRRPPTWRGQSTPIRTFPAGTSPTAAAGACRHSARRRRSGPPGSPRCSPRRETARRTGSMPGRPCSGSCSPRAPAGSQPRCTPSPLSLAGSATSSGPGSATALTRSWCSGSGRSSRWPPVCAARPKTCCPKAAAKTPPQPLGTADALGAV